LFHLLIETFVIELFDIEDLFVVGERVAEGKVGGFNTLVGRFFTFQSLYGNLISFDVRLICGRRRKFILLFFIYYI
jgi:hypothetical protein